MNVFWLSESLTDNSYYHCDIHLNIMLKEATQILSTVCYLNGHDVDFSKLYKPTHFNHPVVQWAKNPDNALTLKFMAINLSDEFYTRTGKCHNSERVIMNLPRTFGGNIKPPFMDYCEVNMYNQTPYPILCESNDEVIMAYRQYYRDKYYEWATREDKRKMFMKWTNREIPEFMRDLVIEYDPELKGKLIL